MGMFGVEISETYDQMSFWGRDDSMPSMESPDGQEPSDSPDSRDHAGRPPSPANPSQLPDDSKKKRTSDTFGPLFADSSSKSDRLQSSVSKSLQRLAGTGSLEYELTWKSWDMKSGPPIYALRASGHRTSGKGYSGAQSVVGWPTAQARDWKGPQGRSYKGEAFDLPAQSQMAGWPTPMVNDEIGSQYCYGPKREDGTRDKFLKLPGASLLAGWATPQASDPVEGRRTDLDSPQKCLGRDMKAAFGPMAGWASPMASDPSWGPNQPALGRDIRWHLGFIAPSSPASTEKRGVLDAAFSRWLMGYPESWDKVSPSFDLYEKAQALIAEDASKDTETPSSPKSEPSS